MKEDNQKRLNLVLIEVDQMRGDCLGIKGHPVIDTQNLNQMAHQGYLFENAYSAVPSCIAARASILTGLSSETHGRVGYHDGVPWNYEITLPGELAKAGYHTQSIGKMHVHPSRNLCGFHNVVLHDGYMGFNRDYNLPVQESWQQVDDYLPWLREKVGPEADIIDSGLECNSWMARPWPYQETYHPTNWVVNQSIDFLRRRDPRKPFFLKMSFVRPHSPLDPPAVYLDRYKEKEIPLPPIGDWAKTEDSEGNGYIIDTIRGQIGKENLKRARRAYYGLITHIDHQIGRFLQVMREYSFLNNTVFIFVSDHGDMLGDHNLYRKAVPYQGSISIPLILFDPGNNLKGSPGSCFDQPVELRDIMPTMLDIARVNIPDSIEGKSLLKIANGETNNWRNYIRGEHSYGDFSNHFLVSKDEKYVWYSQTGREHYFDLNNDPLELHDASEDEAYKKRVNYWRKILSKELDGREEGYSDGEKLITGRKAKACLDHILS